ncbi:Sas10 C-terminal domain-containing protein [Xylogone sp. PMI_703]|nr:Sas10 C-terminal domain-containing protein [Xylogone sp. PMI_703]
MAKKRKASGDASSSGPKEYDPADGKLGPLTTFEDVADSEDEFHMNRDKLMLDEGPGAKRRRKWAEEDALLEPSDEEILGYSSEEDEDEDQEDNNDDYHAGNGRGGAEEGSDEEAAEEDEEDVGGWGSSKKDYYDADNIETEADALEEEEEAKRLQKKKLQKMSEADFGFDENDWADTGKDDDERDVTTEILQDIEITDDMSTQERLQILQSRYPEFEFLANEFLQLQPILETLRTEVEPETSKLEKPTTPSPALIKYRALAAYVAALTMYFAILTAPARTDEGKTKPIDPTELRNHSVMDSLLQCRQVWSKVKSLRARSIEIVQPEDLVSEPDIMELNDRSEEEYEALSKKKSKNRIQEKSISEAATRRAKQMERAEKELADLSNLVPKSRNAVAKRKTEKSVKFADDDSDFGEEETMDAKEAAQKAIKKKSLRFYTSQIAQKANRRADAGRDAGGDADLPYRERLRDRQARLNAEAEKRGKKLDQYGRGAALGGDSDDDEDNNKAVAQGVRDDEDEYYDLVAQTSKKRKAEKDAKHEAIARAKDENKMARITDEELGDDEKRAISYQIQKNKGLAPKRNKDVRNPRVKKRKMFEKSQKKLRSMRAVYKGGEERGGYGGEKTGIKTGVVKSVKL